MSLLHKLRVLAGALVHKPFMPRQEKVDLDEGNAAPAKEERSREHLGSDLQGPEVVDGERVADLIAKQQREQAD
jgi:hypothetical protein